MATPSKRSGWSYSEFARLPADGRRYEVIAGELCVTPRPGTYHQLVAFRLSRLVGGFIEDHGVGWVLGPVDVLFAQGDYLAPDLVFVRRERRGIISDRGIEAAPDLVIEILSGSTAQHDRGIKRERYRHFRRASLLDRRARCAPDRRLPAPAGGRPAGVVHERHGVAAGSGAGRTDASIPDVLRGFD